MSNSIFRADTVSTLLCFLFAGTLQISGAYFLMESIRGNKTLAIGITGGAMIIAAALTMAIVPVTFGRAYAGYAGILGLLALVWGWHYTHAKIEFMDIVGAVLVLAGVCVIVLTPRH